jgi:hypothetical protein
MGQIWKRAFLIGPFRLLPSDLPSACRYNGDRSFEDVSEYIDEHVREFARRAMTSGSPSPIVPNPLGRVLQLTDNTFSAATAEGPIFVKMFAPW